eukprot:scaffold10199_cov146-Cylindrotheca_fusiformis.AAC.12
MAGHLNPPPPTRRVSFSPPEKEAAPSAPDHAGCESNWWSSMDDVWKAFPIPSILESVTSTKPATGQPLDDDRSNVRPEDLVDDELIRPPKSFFFQFYTPAFFARRFQQLRTPHSQAAGVNPEKAVPSKPPPPQKGFWAVYFESPIRRLNFWTVLSIILFGPPIFWAGYFAGQGMAGTLPTHDAKSTPSNGQEPAVAPTIAPALAPTYAPVSYDTNLFMVQNQVISQGDTIYLNEEKQGVHLVQEQDGNLVLFKDTNKTTILWHSGLMQSSYATTTYSTILQGDGNLVTQSKTGSTTTVEWDSKSDSSLHGEYSLILNEQANGMLIVRTIDSQIMWSSLSPIDGSAEDIVTPAPTTKLVNGATRNPTPKPTPGPTPKPTPFPTRPPSPHPTFVRRPEEVSQSTRFQMESGPMLGHVTHESIQIWGFQGANRTMQLVYWPYSEGTDSETLVRASPNAAAKGSSIVTLENLQPNTLYLYEYRIQDAWIAQGHFHTAAAPSDKGSAFRYALASCMNVKSNDGGYVEQPVWNDILSRKPDFALLPGDTVYLNHHDWTSEGEIIYDRVWFRYLQQRRESNFANFIKTVPTYGSWDDHDYGKNDAQHSQKGKETVLAAWKHLWPNPYPKTPSFDGNYYTITRGDTEFFMLDCRWYRNTRTGTLFGEQQLEWLGQALIASKATFKILVSGSDVMEKNMATDVRTIGTVVAANGISGVLFNSGDIHRNEFKVQELETWPYPVMQITSSGVARVWRRPYAIVQVDTTLSDPEVVASFYSADTSAEVTTWSNDPNQICTNIQGTNRHQESRCTQRIRLSELTP